MTKEVKPTDTILVSYALTPEGGFREIALVSPRTEEFFHWTDKEQRSPTENAARFFLKTYPVLANPNPQNEWPLRVIGFSAKTFLQTLQLEASLPTVGKPLNAFFFQNNNSYHDILQILKLDTNTALPEIRTALKRRSPDSAPEALKAWATRIDNWNGPGDKTPLDCILIAELAVQLGLL